MLGINRRHNSTRFFLALIFVLPILAGCAAKGPAYLDAKAQIPALTEGKSRVYFLRKSMFYASGSTAEIHINGLPYAEILDGGFDYVDVMSGKNKIRVSDTMSRAGVGEWTSSFDFKPGEQHYFVISPLAERNVFKDIGSLMSGGGGDPFYNVSHVSEPMANKILPTLKLSRE